MSDAEIAEDILMLMERCKQIVDSEWAASPAAVLHSELDVKGKKPFA